LFLSNFKDSDLPIVIDDLFLNTNIIISNSYPLDTNLVSIFIARNREFKRGVFLYEIYHFYPIAKFKISSSFNGVIYKKEGMSGGIEDLYYMCVYLNNGKKTSEILIGKYISDCSSKVIVTSEIKENKIYIVYKYFQGNSNDDTYIELKHEREEFIMTIDTIMGVINTN
jgi:hypothetical protein